MVVEKEEAALKPETKFRKSKVIPLLLRLKNTAFFPIQQLAIVGDADFILCIRGVFVWLELKKNDLEVPKPLQRHKAWWVGKCGGLAMVAYPENWAVISKKLTALDQGEKVHVSPT